MSNLLSLTAGWTAAAAEKIERLEGGPLRGVDLSKNIDPAQAIQRCLLRRHYTFVNRVGSYHTDLDLTTHFGTHLELSYHQYDKGKNDCPPKKAEKWSAVGVRQFRHW